MWIIFRPTPRAELFYAIAETQQVEQAIQQADHTFRSGETAGIDETAELAIAEPNGNVLAFRTRSGTWFRAS